MGKASTAGMLVIGNELLSGKFPERNVLVLAQLLFSLGIELRRVVVCPDEEEQIIADLRLLKEHHDYVFTSGGVGPTHDDVTMAAVAKAFDAELVRNSKLEELLRDYFGPRLTADHLKMADVPEGVELLWAEDVRWPATLLGNVFILPGLPKVFRMKMAILRRHLQGASPFFARQVATRSDEGTIVGLLSGLDSDFPHVRVGSYPVWNESDWKLIVSFDGPDDAELERAVEALKAALPAHEILD